MTNDLEEWGSLLCFFPISLAFPSLSLDSLRFSHLFSFLSRPPEPHPPRFGGGFVKKKLPHRTHLFLSKSTIRKYSIFNYLLQYKFTSVL
jgi:hypothetical protein